jgi:glucose dehydrogenase
VIRKGVVLVAVVLATGCSSGGSTDESTATSPSSSPPPTTTQPQADGPAWPIFGFTPDRANTSGAPTRITAANADSLKRTTIDVPGTVDSSPIYVGGRFVVTTSYGKTLALDRDGHILWTYVPPGLAEWEGSA